MKRRNLLISLVGIMLVAVLALGATLAAGRSPLLGLDLQGGVSVVLQPHQKTSDAKLQTAVDIIDRRVNKLGVANSTVERQGNDVVIDLPGVKDSTAAIKEVGQTAQLFFRPVDCTILPYAAPTKSTSSSTTTTPKSTTTTEGSSAKTTPTTAKSTTTKKSTKKSAAASTATPARLTGLVTKASPTTTTPATTTPTTTPTTATTVAGGTTKKEIKTSDKYAYLQDACGATNITPNPLSGLASQNYPSNTANNDDSQYSVIIPPGTGTGLGTDRWVLGPADLSGEIVKTASSEYDSSNGEYVVNVTLTSKGLAEFNKVSAQRYKYYSAASTSQNPKAEEALDLDGVLESAPSIEAPTFAGSVQISGQFTSAQASALATELEYGSLPVKFDIGSINTVSATLGHSSLIAGLLAGLGGIILVLLYMILYYRALGLVVVLGLAVGGALLYSILTELSQTSSLALTLSGITGVIVSIGITVDSYVVYFERLKDEIRQGRTIRSSVERGFTRAFKTVLTADLVSFLAALILYLFTVGDVKGFAFTLGLSTLLDVFTAYFFIRPIVVLLGRRRTTSERRFLGIARGLGAVRPEGAA